MPISRQYPYFGIQLTIEPDDPHHTVELARLGESLGYDLLILRERTPATAESAPLDNWTTLTWIAAQTERIRLVASIPHLHRRFPTVLGRQIASLDLLSNGRADLAFGPVESLNDIEALGEAIDIVRAIVDVGEPGTVAIDGQHYPIMGAQRGPLPLHTIPIWFAGTALPLLDLIGQEADGWIGTPDELARVSPTLDASAIVNDRDPAEIERLVLVQANDPLLPSIVDHHASGFLLDTDDPAVITRFADETIPALRAELIELQPDRSTPPPRRSTRIRAKRFPGIDYEAIPPSLQTHAIEPGDTSYPRFRSNYLRGGNPGLVLQPGNPEEVAEAIGFARNHRDLPLSVRSRGHGISGRSTNEGGLIIDLRRMNQIEILDETTRRIRVGPAARWMDIAVAIQPYGWALSSGDYGGVGVGGLATAGGVGLMVREHGLTIDHLRAAEIVLADGSFLRTDANENPDLFWAIRGAGANMGIVTAFEFETDAVGQVGWAQLILDATDTAAFLQNWGNWIENAPRDTTSFMIMGQQRGSRQSYAHTMTMIDSDDPEVIVARLQPLADVARVLQQQITITRYVDVIANANEHYHQAQGEPAVRSGLLEHITPEFAEAASTLIHSGASYFFQIRAMGGAVADIPPDATAFANRSANFSVVAFGASSRQLDRFWDEMHPHFDGIYLNFETDTRPERLLEAFPEPTLTRLRSLKDRYDPTNLFRDNFNVTNFGIETVYPPGNRT